MILLVSLILFFDVLIIEAGFTVLVNPASKFL